MSRVFQYHQFNILPQFYGYQPVDEVIRRSQTGVARSGNATGFNPWLFTFYIVVIYTLIASLSQAGIRPSGNNLVNFYTCKIMHAD